MDESDTPNSLRETFDRFRPSEILGWDLVVGLLGGGGAVWLAIVSPDRLRGLIDTAGTLVGVIVGAVIAAVAILAAFLDQTFLRKLRRIKKEPSRYIAPSLFTASLGVLAAISLLVLGALPLEPAWLIAVFGGLSGLLVTWTLASLLPNLSVLIQFLGLQFDASNVPDIPPPQSEDPPHPPLAAS